MKRNTWIIAALSVCLLLSGCVGFIVTTDNSMTNAVDRVANVIQAEDAHVLSVKNGAPLSYPDITYDQAFSAFFSEPAWKYFVGTRNGPDDNGDGEPDYVTENIDVVEFTGYCMYQDVRVKALIQFAISEEGDTFEAMFLSFNEVPQSGLMLIGLIDKAFETYAEKRAETASSIGAVGSETVQETEAPKETADIPSDGFLDYLDWNGFYFGGWMDTALTFELYPDDRFLQCGYIAFDFRGNVDSGDLYYLGDNQFQCEISGSTYIILAVVNDALYQLEIYDADGNYDVTYTLESSDSADTFYVPNSADWSELDSITPEDLTSGWFYDENNGVGFAFDLYEGKLHISCDEWPELVQLSEYRYTCLLNYGADELIFEFYRDAMGDIVMDWSDNGVAQAPIWMTPY